VGFVSLLKWNVKDIIDHPLSLNPPP